MEQTLGQKRVRANFNPSNDNIVDRIKQNTADLIDLLQAVKNDEASKNYEETPQQLQDRAGEKFRLIEFAQAAYEGAAMWAVKAVTAQ